MLIPSLPCATLTADLRTQADAAERAASDASSTSSTHEASASVAAEAIGELGRQRCFCGAAVCSGWLGKKVDKTRGAQAGQPTLPPVVVAKKGRPKLAAEAVALKRARSESAVAAEVGDAGRVAVKTEQDSPVGKACTIETSAKKVSPQDARCFFTTEG